MQNIFVYIIVAIAVGYIVKTYIIPKKKSSKNSKDCGEGNCGCH